MTALAAASALGLFSAIVWAKYIRTVVAKTPWRAAVYDGAVILPGLLTKQIWAAAGNDFVIFAAYLGGSMVGTYLVVRLST